MLLSVLLVDDNPTFLRVLTRFLTDQNEIALEVVGTVIGGEEAVAQAETLQPDVVLVDLQMPLRSGLELLPHLRVRLPDARLIALTLLDPDSFRQPALAAGADAFVSKARLEHDLLPAIRSFVPLQYRRGPCLC
jgi:DNA-binding NarL/FixJ family response regulator